MIYFLLAILGLLIIIWRLRRRVRNYEIRHIIDELNYIARNYDHRIPPSSDPELSEFIDSIHSLVDSTLEAMEEERGWKPPKMS